MSNGTLIQRTSIRCDLSVEQIQTMWDALYEEIVEALTRGEIVKLLGLVSLGVRFRSPTTTSSGPRVEIDTRSSDRLKQRVEDQVKLLQQSVLKAGPYDLTNPEHQSV